MKISAFWFIFPNNIVLINMHINLGGKIKEHNVLQGL